MSWVLCMPWGKSARYEKQRTINAAAEQCSSREHSKYNTERASAQLVACSISGALPFAEICRTKQQASFHNKNINSQADLMLAQNSNFEQPNRSPSLIPISFNAISIPMPQTLLLLEMPPPRLVSWRRGSSGTPAYRTLHRPPLPQD